MGSGAGSNSQSHPADVLVSNWDLGKPAAFDLSVTSTLLSSVLLEASMKASSAALVAEKRKHNTNDRKCACMRNWVGTASHLWLRPMGVGVLQQWWPFLSLQVAFSPG